MIDSDPPGGFFEIQPPKKPIRTENPAIGFFSRIRAAFGFVFFSQPLVNGAIAAEVSIGLAESRAAMLRAEAKVKVLESDLFEAKKRIAILEASKEVLETQVKLSAETINAHLARLQMDSAQSHAYAAQARRGTG